MTMHGEGDVGFEGLDAGFRTVVLDFVVASGSHVEGRLGMNEARRDGSEEFYCCLILSKTRHLALGKAVFVH